MTQDYSVRQLADLVGVHPDTLRRLARAGRLPGAYRVGTRWRFAYEAIEELRGQVICSPHDADIQLLDLRGEELE
jgi:excisionase family DNA binding protein